MLKYVGELAEGNGSRRWHLKRGRGRHSDECSLKNHPWPALCLKRSEKHKEIQETKQCNYEGVCSRRMMFWERKLLITVYIGEGSVASQKHSELKVELCIVVCEQSEQTAMAQLWGSRGGSRSSMNYSFLWLPKCPFLLS